nr:MAG TPA_asm: hypothetical protein [Caudoviricetes sp.]
MVARRKPTVQDVNHWRRTAPAKNDTREEPMANAMKPRYTFRPGALDAIARSRNLHTDEQLALFVGIRPADLAKVRAGAAVSAEVALRVSALQGDKNYIAGYFDLVEQHAAA